MCLLVVASRLVPDTPLVVGANRDEVLERPSTAVTVLHPGPPASWADATSSRGAPGWP